MKERKLSCISLWGQQQLLEAIKDWLLERVIHKLFQERYQNLEKACSWYFLSIELIISGMNFISFTIDIVCVEAYMLEMEGECADKFSVYIMMNFVAFPH